MEFLNTERGPKEGALPITHQHCSWHIYGSNKISHLVYFKIKLKIYHYPWVGLSFSPGGDSQPEITKAAVAAAASGRRAERLPGSDLNFNIFPITAVWAGKITRGKQALFFSCFSGQLLSSPSGVRRFGLLYLLVCKIWISLGDMWKPLVFWDDGSPGLGISMVLIQSSGTQETSFANCQIVEKVLCLLGLRDQDQGLDSSGDQGSVYNQH